MKLLLGSLLAVLLVLPLAVVPWASSDAPYGAYNDRPDGTSWLYRRDGWHLELANGRPAALLHGGLESLDPERHALLVLGGRRAFAPAEVDAAREFLLAGGRALVADDHGSARAFVEDLDVGVTVPGVAVFTPGYAKAPDFPIAFSTGALPLMPDEVVLNKPSVVDGAGLPVLVAPQLSWRDANGNGRPDLDEPQGAWSVARLVHVGAGQLLVLGDPSVFTAEMRPVDGAAVGAFLGWVSEGGRLVLVDESHRAAADPFGAGRALAGRLPAPVAAGLLLAAAALVAFVTLKPGARRVRPARRRRPPARAPALTAAEQAALAEFEAPT